MEIHKTINGANMIWGNNLLKGFCPYLHQGCWITLPSHLHSSFTHTDCSTIMQTITPSSLGFILYECVYLLEGVEKTPRMTVPALHAYDGAGGLQQVEVEVRVSRDRAVQTCFQKRRPLTLQNPLRAPQITFTHTCHAGHHHLIHTHTFKRRRFSFYSTQPLFSAIIKVTIHWRTAFQPHTSIMRIQLFDSSVKTSRDMLCSTAFYYFQQSSYKVGQGFLCQRLS